MGQYAALKTKGLRLQHRYSMRKPLLGQYAALKTKGLRQCFILFLGDFQSQYAALKTKGLRPCSLELGTQFENVSMQP